MTKKCKTCVVRGTCTKNHIDGTLCDEVFVEVTKMIDKFREQADYLEDFYGLQAHYYEKMEREYNKMERESREFCGNEDLNLMHKWVKYKNENSNQ
jgi:hypothetical protein